MSVLQPPHSFSHEPAAVVERRIAFDDGSEPHTRTRMSNVSTESIQSMYSPGGDSRYSCQSEGFNARPPRPPVVIDLGQDTAPAGSSAALCWVQGPRHSDTSEEGQDNSTVPTWNS